MATEKKQLFLKPREYYEAAIESEPVVDEDGRPVLGANGQPGIRLKCDPIRMLINLQEIALDIRELALTVMVAQQQNDPTKAQIMVAPPGMKFK